MLDSTEKKRNVQHILALNLTTGKRVFSLNEPQYSIGRYPKNSIVISAEGISRQHATLIRKHKNNDHFSYVIIDGNVEGYKSKNGIAINGDKIDKSELKHGDVIYFTKNITAHYYIIDQESQGFIPELTPSGFLAANSSHLISLSTDTQIIERTNKQPTLSEISNLASVVELSPIPIIEINYQGIITYLNPSANLKFPDLEKAELQHPILKELLEKQNYKNGSLVIREVNIKDQTFEQHIHYLAKEKLIRSYIFDITQRKKAETELKYHAFHDGLTGLPNRSFFDQHISLMIKNSERHNKSFAVLFIDIDSFKNINDTLGHTIGDQILKCVAQRLTSQVRKSDLVSRWGGDEFVVLLSEIENPDEAAKFSQRLLQAFEHPLNIERHQIYLKCSVGIAIYPEDGQESETLLKNADAALYRTKESGRNHYQFYNPEMSVEIAENFALESQLHQAIKNGELILHYQPQINVKTGKVYGLEALVRWNSPKLGLVRPNKFIPLAEKTGLIIPMGEWVLKTACQQNKKWQNMGLPPIRVAVNLSAQQLQQSNLIETVENTLESVGLDPEWLELEVTESILMKNIALASQTLQELRNMGVYISIDDFGTGYSSLGYLKKFPFNTLKIDQSFVKEINQNPQDVSIISAIMTLSRGFNMRVIAEGVENREQLELLQKLECEEMQGYFFSHPLSPDEILNYLINFNQQKHLIFALS
ncbi:MAG: EAL domain-containing protein [Crocosphaera sp.]|nr:EAL domain-containing protein [Crocosphaera sp.]